MLYPLSYGGQTSCQDLTVLSQRKAAGTTTESM